MASREIKNLLKAAKAALDRQEFDTANLRCQDVFQIDDKNYMGLVFAGLACLKLGEYARSRQHYKTAIGLQPDGPLAWKGFADYYDNHKPVVKDDQLEAIEIYTRLIDFIESDPKKICLTYHKLICLHREFNHQDEVITCYKGLLSTFNSSDLPESDVSERLSEVWHNFISYMLGRDEISEEYWTLVQQGLSRIQEGESKQKLRGTLVKKLHVRYMGSNISDLPLREFIEQECRSLLSADPLIALPILVHLLVMHTIPSSVEEMVHKPVSLLEQQRKWIDLLYTYTQADAEGSSDNHPATIAQKVSLGWVGHALACMADKKWIEARDAIKKSLSFSSVMCECLFLSSLLNLLLRDYHTAEKAVENGLTLLSNSAKFMSAKLELNLKLCQCEVYIGRGNSKQLHQALPLIEEKLQEACDNHVITLLVKAYLFLGDVSSAQLVLEKQEKDSVLMLRLQGEICLVEKKYLAALAKVDAALKEEPTSPLLLFIRAKILWEDPQQDRSKVYPALLQAAKADPLNPDTFLYLGHYQKQVAGDLERAEKCYQKAILLQPSHVDSAMSLGDMLWMDRKEEKAYEIYRNITSYALPSRTKVAWLRMGLYQGKKKEYNESIKSFQTILSSFPDDKHLWECLGQAYLARGSYNSALRTFTKCVQMDPESIYCHYQIATINQLLGLLQESLNSYSVVLEKDPSFVPALKGKGETYLKLARLSLQQNFDGTAVDYISSAIKNLTLAAWLHPEFVCVWKLLGDSCTCLNQVSPLIARPHVPNVLRSGNSKPSEMEYERVDKQELLEIGCRCYGKALQIHQEAAYLWHDLSLNYFYLAKCLDPDNVKKQQMFETSLKAAKKAASLNSSSHRCWNTLGVIAACREINNAALAQHSFIRSLQEEENNAVAWANLGTLYLKHDNTELSYEAFKKAQSLSPDCVQAWIGHALVAERIGSSEAMDLFRHSTELEYHSEASSGYGYWVCQTLESISPKLFLNPGGTSLNEAALRGVLQARDNLQKLSMRSMADACTLNYLGLLYEHEGLIGEARKTFLRALESCSDQTDSNVLAIKFNLARVQSTLGYMGEAVLSLMGICKEENSSTVWLEVALALYRENNLTDSLQAYEQSIVINERISNEDKKSAVLTAQAMVAFANGDSDTSQKYLFQAFQSTPVSLHGLVTLSVLACLNNDSTLLLATLQELDKYLEWQADEAYLLHPSCSRVLHAEKFLLTRNPNIPNECIEAIDKVIKNIPEHTEPFMLPPLPLSLHTMAANSSIYYHSQKLVHTYPNNVWALAMLTAQISQHGLRKSYNYYTKHLVESELAKFSAGRNLSPWQKSQEKSLNSLKHWLNRI